MSAGAAAKRSATSSKYRPRIPRSASVCVCRLTAYKKGWRLTADAGSEVGQFTL